MKDDIIEQMQAFYGGAIPGYIVKAGKTFLMVRLAQWDDKVYPTKITLTDVVEYYRTQANNLSSGIRSIAGFSGDWRHIDNVAKECLAWFKYVNVKQLRRQSRKVGLEPHR